MKILLILFLTLTNISCNQESSNIKSDLTNSENKIISDNKDIFGSWSMCATADSSSMFQMNTCQTIKFNIDGTGSVEPNSSFTENFVWTLKNSGIKIIYGNKTSNPTFPDTLYFAHFTK